MGIKILHVKPWGMLSQIQAIAEVHPKTVYQSQLREWPS